jgi:hypothetical protein
MANQFKVPDAQSVRQLMANPKLAPQFDNIFGPGSSNSILQFSKMGSMELAGRGAYQPIEQLGMGIKQLAMQGGNQLGMVSPQAVADYQRRVDEQAAQDQALLDNPSAMAGNVAGNIGMALVPGGLLTQGLKYGVRGAQGVSQATALANAAARGYVAPVLTGAAQGGLAAATSDQNRATNAALGGALNVGGKLVGNLIGDFANGMRPNGAVSQAVSDSAAKLKALGIELTPGQSTSSKPIRIMESVVANLPTGAPIRRAREKTGEQFTKAVEDASAKSGPQLAADTALRRAGEVGQKAAEQFVNEVGSGIRAISAKSDVPLDGVFGLDVIKALNALSSLPPAFQKNELVQGLKQFYLGIKTPNPMLEGYTEPKFRQMLIDKGIPEFIEKEGMIQKGFMAGADYQDQRSLYSSLANKLSEGGQQKQAEIFRGLRDALDTARDKSLREAGGDAAADELIRLRNIYGRAAEINQRFAQSDVETVGRTLLSNSDNIYDDLKPFLSNLIPTDQAGAAGKNVLPLVENAYVRKLVEGATEPTGQINPARLGNAMQVDARRIGATQDDLLQNNPNLVDLARGGTLNMKDTIPDSGTAQRSFFQKLATNPVALFTGQAGVSALGGSAMGLDPATSIGLGLALPYALAKGMTSPMARSIADSTGQGLSIPLRLIDELGVGPALAQTMRIQGLLNQ